MHNSSETYKLRIHLASKCHAAKEGLYNFLYRVLFRCLVQLNFLACLHPSFKVFKVGRH